MERLSPYAVGTTLYVPSTAWKYMENILAGKYGVLPSVTLCLEDSIDSSEVAQGMECIERFLAAARQSDGQSHIFIRPRDGGNLSALFYRAYANNNLRRYEQARSDYADFLRMAPDNMEARFGLAYTYSRMGRSQEALDELNNLVEMYPDSSVVYAARAELEKDMKQYDTALYDFDEALKRDPGNRDYTVSKVEILILLDRRGEAKAALDEAVKRGVPRGLLLGLYAKCK